MLRRVAAVGAGGVGLAVVSRSFDLPVAFHEAGHAVVALHTAREGVPSRLGQLNLHGTTPTLLRFTTIKPRTTEKGVLYLGETKLTTRWKHMHMHARWELAAQDLPAEVPQMRLELFSDAEFPAGGQPRMMLTLARIAYLMGGCAQRPHLCLPLKHWPRGWLTPGWLIPG